MFPLFPFVKYGDKYQAVIEFSQFHAMGGGIFSISAATAQKRSAGSFFSFNRPFENFVDLIDI